MALFRTLIRVALLAAAWLALVAPAGAATDPEHAPPSPEAQATLDRLERAQAGVRTLRATVQATRSGSDGGTERLLGVLSFERPNRLRLESTAPETRLYVLDRGQLTGWVPARNEVERLDVTRFEGRLLRMAGLGSGTRALLREYQVAAGRHAADGDELVLTPRSRQFRKNVREVRLWVGRAPDLPRRITFEAKDGGRITVELQAIEVNPPLADADFTVHVPPGARTVNGFRSLGLLPPDDEF